MIKLIDITKTNILFGSSEGKKVYQKLLSVIQKNAHQQIFEISLIDIQTVDSTFFRESIVSIVKQLTAEKAVYVTDIKSTDVVDNLNYAAIIKQQPVYFWNNKKYRILGPVITTVTQELIDTVINFGPITSADIAEKLNITARNASVKLNKLFKSGLVFRDETVAPSGGREFLYKKIK